MSMDFFPAEQARKMADAANNPSLVPEPGIWGNFGPGSVKEAMHGFAGVASAIDLAGAVGPMASDALTGGTEQQDAYFAEHQQLFKPVMDHWAPKPGEVGTAGRVVGGMLSTLPTVALSPGLAVGSTILSTGEDLVNQGVSGGKAAAVGVIQGTGLGLGLRFAPFGSTLTGRALLGGAGANVAQGVVTRGLSGAVLSGEEAGKQFNPWDHEGLILDGLMGLGFGVMRHAEVSNLLKHWEGMSADERQKLWPTLPSGDRALLKIADMHAAQLNETSRAAILTANQARHLEDTTAPGTPQTEAGAIGHADAIKSAVNDLLNDRQPNVEQRTQSVRMEPNDIKAQDQQQVREQIAQDAPKAVRSADGGPDIGMALDVRLQRDYKGLRKEYEALNSEDANSHGGTILNTDVARELSPEYRADRSRSAEVHEPASAFVKRLYADKLKEIPKGSTVMFTAGGTGAGKSSALRSVPSKHIGLTYDTNMNGLESSVKKVEQALAAGHKVEINYVFRDPVEALVNGSLPRAERMGRTVPMIEHLRTHVGSLETIAKLIEHYKDNPDVKIRVIDNSHGAGGQRLSAVEHLPKLEYNALERSLYAALEQEHDAGRISGAVYRGSGGRTDIRRSDDGKPAGRVHEAQDPQERSGSDGGLLHERSAERAGSGLSSAKPGADGAGSAHPPRDETSGSDEPPAPGVPFIVYRAGSSGTLEHRNGGNADGVARHLVNVQDDEGGAHSSADRVFAYEVTLDQPFGKYEGLNQGDKAKGDSVGRTTDRNMVAYSFGEGGYTAREIGSKSLDELHALLKQKFNKKNFDYAGATKGGEAIREAFEPMLKERDQAGAPDAAAPEAAKPEAAKPTPLYMEAESQLNLRPDMKITMEDGTSVSLAEMYHRARAEVEVAEMDKGLFETAAACLMGAV